MMSSSLALAALGRRAGRAWMCSGTLSAVAGPVSNLGAALGVAPVPAFPVPLVLFCPSCCLVWLPALWKGWWAQGGQAHGWGAQLGPSLGSHELLQTVPLSFSPLLQGHLNTALKPEGSKCLQDNLGSARSVKDEKEERDLRCPHKMGKAGIWTRCWSPEYSFGIDCKSQLLRIFT